MTDTNINPKNIQSINDYESQDGTSEENYNDNDNLQPIIQNNYDIPPVQEGNNLPSSEEMYYNNTPKNNNNKIKIAKISNRSKRIKILMIAISIIFILIFLFDCGLQIVFEDFNLLILLDATFLLILAVIYLYLIYKRKPLPSRWLGTLTFLCEFFGLPMRTIGAGKIKSEEISLTQAILFSIRCALNFICFFYTIPF